MSDKMQLVTAVICLGSWALGMYQGWLSGQVKANREHLAYLRGACDRADRMSAEMTKYIADRDGAS